MNAGHRVRTLLPPSIQDALRLVRDTLSPARHRAAILEAVSTGELSIAVSPRGVVLGGPFVGLRLPLAAAWGGLPARLAGTYEEEIAPWVLDALQRRPETIVDVGAAEGYYAVGIARALPGSEVVAFELDPHGRRLCRETANLNHVSNIRVIGRATPKRLNRELSPGSLLLCDCEGYEVELINPSTVPAVRDVDAIIEVHEFASPGVTDLLTRRLEPTHAVTRVEAIPRSLVGRPQLRHLEPRVAAQAMEEGRPTAPGPMAWLICLSRRGRLSPR